MQEEKKDFCKCCGADLGPIVVDTPYIDWIMPERGEYQKPPMPRKCPCCGAFEEIE
jgi:hypothetical protein